MSLTGRAVALVAAGIVPVLLVPSAATVLAWAVLATALCALDLALAGSPRRLVVRRVVPASVRLTESAPAELLVANSGSRTVRGLVRDAWQPSAGAAPDRHPLTLPPGEARRLTTVLRPVRRGELAADRVTVRAHGPLHLAARQASLTVPGSVRVLPEFRSRRHLPSRLARLREMDGRSAVQVRAPGTEFDSLRAYVEGDDVRAIDWRATARRSEVVVRTWRPERDRRVFLVLDCSRLSAARLGEGTRLEAEIDAALLLAALATRAGDRVELVAVDRAVRARVAGESGATLLAALADAAVPLTPALVEPDWRTVTGLVRRGLPHRSLVVLLTALEPAAVEYGLLPAVGSLARRHQVVVASAADPAVAALRTAREERPDVFAVAAAERAGLERDAVASGLRRAGVEVVDVGPDDLAAALADAYLALKAAGRL
jgi:uncharacterized protein (DUF58 family)